jgi:Cu/Ag efflux pump CusA
MVHAINARRADGLEFIDAVRSAAILRFRPIVLTTATTFLGLLPLMFESAVPATPFVPMAISLGFGVLYASIMTLFLVPVGYVILDDLIRFVESRRADVGARRGGSDSTLVTPSETLAGDRVPRLR